MRHIVLLKTFTMSIVVSSSYLEKKVIGPHVVGTVELLPATAQVHVALLDHQLHVPQPANPAAGLSELHIIWRIFT